MGIHSMCTAVDYGSCAVCTAVVDCHVAAVNEYYLRVGSSQRVAVEVERQRTIADCHICIRTCHHHLRNHKARSTGVALVGVLSYIECVAIVGNVECQHTACCLALRCLVCTADLADAVVIHMVVVWLCMQMVVGILQRVVETHIAFPYKITLRRTWESHGRPSIIAQELAPYRGFVHLLAVEQPCHFTAGKLLSGLADYSRMCCLLLVCHIAEVVAVGKGAFIISYYVARSGRLSCFSLHRGTAIAILNNTVGGIATY